MEVYIPALERDCPAALALDREGVDYRLFLIENDLSYSSLLKTLWRDKNGFILIEHDIAPWPGAIQLMKDCKEDLCVHTYHPAPNKLFWALGCVKFSDALINNTPQITESLTKVYWAALDGIIYPQLKTAGYLPPHIHMPPVAHVKK